MFGHIGVSVVRSLALAGILAACSTASPGPPSAGPSATVPATETPPPSPTTSPTVGPAAWSRLAWSPGTSMPGGQFLSDLVRSGNGYVGVGGIESGSGLEVAFFRSSDGARWTLAGQQSTTEGNVFAAHVVPLGNRLLAVGQAVMNAPGEKPGFPPPLWVSEDGITWSEVASPSWKAAFSTVWPNWLLASPAGVVALSSGTDPVVASSTDGSTWTAATLPMTERAIAMDAGAWSGGFVIVGRDGQPDQFSPAVINSQSPPGTGLPAAWTSPDGVHWSEATVEGTRVPGAALTDVVAVRAGLVAAGVSSTAGFYAGSLTSWTSSDGRTWSIAGGSGWPLGAGLIPTLAGDGERALLLGRAPEGPTLAAWVTTDGLAWTRLTVESPDDAPPIDCGTHADCVRIDGAWLVSGGVIVAGTETGGTSVQHVWLAVPAS